MVDTYLVCPKHGEVLIHHAGCMGETGDPWMAIRLERLYNEGKLGNCKKCGSPLSIEKRGGEK